MKVGFSANGAMDANDARARSGAAAWLMVVYLWYFITTPDVHFPILADIHFERILVALVVVAIVAGQRPPRRLLGTSVLLVLFYLWMLLSYSMSDYQNEIPAQWWIENYWKFILFYFFLTYSIRNLEDFYVLATGLCVISFLYQLHSWYDYINGGSYVFQQGIKRIIGVWSGGGIGAANNFGLLGLFSLPFGIFWLNLARQRTVKAGLIAYLAVCFATIAFSGTRAAMLGALVVLFLTYWRNLFRIKIVIPLVVGVVLAVSMLPDDLKHRYLDLIFVDEYAEVTDSSDKIAEESAKSRIQGLEDGWLLAQQKPVMGYGPGSSAFARRLVNTTSAWVLDEDEYLELHNLYGQVMAETGFIGAGLFLLLVFSILLGLRPSRLSSTDVPGGEEKIKAARELLLTSVLLMLFYGMFAHSLYRYYWLLLFALYAGLAQIAHRPQVVLTGHFGAPASPLR